MEKPRIYVYNACEITANPIPDDTYFYSHPDNPSFEQWIADCETSVQEANYNVYGDLHKALSAKGYVLMENEVCWYDAPNDYN